MVKSPKPQAPSPKPQAPSPKRQDLDHYRSESMGLRQKISDGLLLGLVTALGSENRPQPVRRGAAGQEITVDIRVFLCKGIGV